MINANELRRLNLVAISKGALIGLEEEKPIVNIWEVDKITPDHISLFNNHENIYDTFHVSMIEPIKLDEYSILNFDGFEKIKDTNIYVINMHRIGVEKLKSLAVYLDENDYTVSLVDYYSGIEKTEILHLNYEYIHDIQNLFFYLSKQELTIRQ